MEPRKWEDLESDCLLLIFQKLGIDDLAVAVRFVCKSWASVSFDPLCWKSLNFRNLDFMPWSKFSKNFTQIYSLKHRFTFSGFMKLAIHYSRGLAMEIRFPLIFGATMEDLNYAATKCARLKVVGISNLMLEEKRIPELVAKWQELEFLEIESKPSSFVKTVESIGIHCKKFAGLKMQGSIKNEDSSAIVDRLPNIKFLDLCKSYLPKEELLKLVAGCRKLERLSVRDCYGFEADEEVLEKVSLIKYFDYEGSKLIDDYGYETDEFDYPSVQVL